MVCIRGIIDVIVDDGIQKKKFTLSEYGKAISVPPGFWCAQNYSAMSSLMVLCSHLYNEKDYVRDYDKYLLHKKYSRMKIVIVTGGLGHIGSKLVRYLIDNDCHVICIDNLLTQRLISLRGLIGNFF